MGIFLAILPRQPGINTTTRSRSGIDLARRLKGQPPTNTLDSALASVTVFSRRNGTGGQIVIDAASNSWLLAVGTWFHRDGYGSGAEPRLLSRYLESDAVTLARELDGFFCLVIGDARRNETLVVTDIAGSCHCFMREEAATIALSGSSLLLAALSDFHLDNVGCQEFLQTGVIYEDRTCYTEVRKLGPASIYRFRLGAVPAVESYWAAKALSADSLEGSDAVGRLWESLTTAVRKVGALFPRVVCDLTGGYDSRAMVAAFCGAGVPFATTVSGPARSADVRISTELAQALGVAHQHQPPGGPPSIEELSEAIALTDGEYDAVEYTQVARVHRALMQRFDISINGSFGELARGYWWELLMPNVGERRTLNATLVARRRFAASPSDRLITPRNSDIELASHMTEVIRRTNAGLEDAPNTLQMDHAYLRMRMQRWQGRIASSTNQLWPCLSPFMFRPVLEAMMQTRGRLRLRSLLIRQMLARFQPVLANSPLEYGYPASPLSWRNWYRFWPVLAHYAMRAGDKALRIAGLSALRKRSRSRVAAARLILSREPQIQDALDPTRMRLVCLIEESNLSGFLARAKHPDFGLSDQWARVLTLELSLQLLEEAGARPRP